MEQLGTHEGTSSKTIYLISIHQYIKDEIHITFI